VFVPGIPGVRIGIRRPGAAARDRGGPIDRFGPRATPWPGRRLRGHGGSGREGRRGTAGVPGGVGGTRAARSAAPDPEADGGTAAGVRVRPLQPV